MLSCTSSLYILDINPLSKSSFVNISLGNPREPNGNLTRKNSVRQLDIREREREKEREREIYIYKINCFPVFLKNQVEKQNFF